ncbi:hypothetical protein EDD86DRAFT_201017 [Gorgonomyces haynaldii]|nr:hypothetical protein EDD86DRAFT_201017 [Gorgonomyces haynaldii]
MSWSPQFESTVYAALCGAVSFALAFYNSYFELLFAIPILIGCYYIYQQHQRVVFYMMLAIGIRTIPQFIWTGYIVAIYQDANKTCYTSKSTPGCKAFSEVQTEYTIALCLNLVESVLTLRTVFVLMRFNRQLKASIDPTPKNGEADESLISTKPEAA